MSYDDRQIAKDWGFIWDGERQAWERLINPEAVDLMPFPVVLMICELDSKA